MVLGYSAKIGAWLIVLFMVPVTLTMHNFWVVQDPTQAQMQTDHFHEGTSPYSTPHRSFRSLVRGHLGLMPDRIADRSHAL